MGYKDAYEHIQHELICPDVRIIKREYYLREEKPVNQ